MQVDIDDERRREMPLGDQGMAVEEDGIEDEDDDERQPVASTSRLPPPSAVPISHSPNSLPPPPPPPPSTVIIDVVRLPLSAAAGEGDDDEDEKEHHHRTGSISRTRSITPPPPPVVFASQSPSLKGKERQSSITSSSSPSLLPSPRDHFNPIYALPGSTNGEERTTRKEAQVHILSPWQQSEIDRLKVEKQDLARQLQVLASKRTSKREIILPPTPGPDQVEDGTYNLTTPQEISYLRQQLQSSEAERHRLKQELKSLKLFLLSGVRLTSTTYNRQHSQSQARALDIDVDHDDEDGNEDESPTATDDGGANPQEGTAAADAALSARRMRMRRRRAMMGDAETEHLLLAAARIGKISRTLDLNDHTVLHHLASLTSDGTASHHRRSKRQRTRSHTHTHQHGHGHGHGQRAAESVSGLLLPPLPPPAAANPNPNPDLDYALDENEYASAAALVAGAGASIARISNHRHQTQAYLGSPMLSGPPGSAGIKLEEDTRPHGGARSYTSFFASSSSSSSSSAPKRPVLGDNIAHAAAAAPFMAPTASSESREREKEREREGRKIGRPLGSPNKTKLIPINDTQAHRRRARASAYANSNGGRKRGRGRPLTSSSSSSPGRQQHEMQRLPPLPLLDDRRYGTIDPDSSTAASVQSHQQENRADQDALLLHPSVYGDALEQDDEEDLEWPEPIQQEIDGETYSPPQQGPYAPKASNASRHNRVAFPPATPASLEGPDMTRYPNRPTLPFLPLSNMADLPPTTPGRSLEPPQTPSTLQKERSALDLLAEEAASASKGASAGVRDVPIASGSGRNLARELDFASSSSSSTTRAGFGVPADASTLRASPYDYRHIFGGTGDADSSTQYSQHISLGEPFRPEGSTSSAFDQDDLDIKYHSHRHQQSDASDSHHELYRPRRPRTIAEQLARGVDVSHPLIDPEDLEAGMTPAAALAKKSRSPYVKWTVEEDEALIKGVAEFGTKWESVARLIPSRSYHQCRQRWLRGLKSGEALPSNMEYLRPRIENAIQAYEQTRVTKKPEQA